MLSSVTERYLLLNDANQPHRRLTALKQQPLRSCAQYGSTCNLRGATTIQGKQPFHEASNSSKTSNRSILAPLAIRCFDPINASDGLKTLKPVPCAEYGASASKAKIEGVVLYSGRKATDRRVGNRVPGCLESMHSRQRQVDVVFKTSNFGGGVAHGSD